MREDTVRLYDLLMRMSAEEVLAVAGIPSNFKRVGPWLRMQCAIHGGGDENFAIGSAFPFKWRCFSHHCEDQAFSNDGIGLIGLMTNNDRDGVKQILLSYLGVNEKLLTPFEVAKNKIWASQVLLHEHEEGHEQTLTMDHVVNYYNNGCKYFSGRGYKQETIDKFLLGTCYCWKNREETRATIPIFDVDNNLVAIQGRAIQEDTKKKYDFNYGANRSGLLYNLNNVVKTPYRRQLTVVEGAPTVWHFDRLGITNTVATFGSTPNKNQILMLAKYADSIIIFPDGDEAGKAMIEKIKSVASEFLSIYVTPVDKWFDPEHTTREDIDLLINLSTK